MFLFSEQFANGTKTNLDAPLTIINALTSKTFEGLEEIIELNMSTVRASLTDTLSSTKELLSAKGPQEFFTLSTTLIQPNIEKLLAYGRQLSSISASTQAEFIKAAAATAPATKAKDIKMATVTPIVEALAVKAVVAAPEVAMPVVKASVPAPVVVAPAVETPAVKAPAAAAQEVQAPAAKAAAAIPAAEVPAIKAVVAAANKKKPVRFKK